MPPMPRESLQQRTLIFISYGRKAVPRSKADSGFVSVYGTWASTHASDDFPNSGHHHLFIDVNEPLDLNAPIPQDRNHLHFGAGQTEAHLELPPGKHTLQLVLGDAKHYPFNPPLVSKKITITVVK
jgi:hypothetical protein